MRVCIIFGGFLACSLLEGFCWVGCVDTHCEWVLEWYEKGRQRRPFCIDLSIFDTFDGKSHVYWYGFEIVHYAFAGVRAFEV